MKTKLTKLVLGLLLGVAITSPTRAAESIPVTVDNFTRAETDTYFANIVKEAGGPGKFFHRREVEPLFPK